MTEQEAQQAQTIAEIKRFDLEQRSKKMMVWEEMAESADGDYVLYVDHKAIVDSQAQKILELTTENNGRALIIDAARSEIERLTQQIADQAMEIERLKSILEIVSPTILLAINSKMDIQIVDVGPQLAKRADSKEVAR